MKKKILLLGLLTLGVSQEILANINDPVYSIERTNRLSFIPRISFGKDLEANFGNGFKGIEADILYGVNDLLEVGATIGWTKYHLDYSDNLKNDLSDYDDSLDAYSLLGTLRYTFRGEEMSPYLTVRGGWVFGDTMVEFTNRTDEAKIEAKWQLGVAAGIEFYNVNFELGYKVTEFESSISPSSEDSFDRESLAYVSLGYRFE